MAIKSLLGTPSLCGIGAVNCDGVVREVHLRSAELTEHAVEVGNDVADSYKKRPDGLIIDGIISRTPIATGFPGQSAINSVANLITGTDPVEAAWDQFEKYMDDGTEIPVVTGKKYYPRMVIMDLEDSRQTNDWMQFTITLRAFRTAYTTSVEAIADQAIVTAETTAQKAISKGNQLAAEAESEAAKESILAAATGFGA